MLNKNKILFTKIKSSLKNFNNNIFKIPLITDDEAISALTLQIIDSIRRVQYVDVISNRPQLVESTNPKNPSFNPIIATSYFRQAQKIDEAAWLTFLLTYFGKNKSTGWNLLRAVYGAAERTWTWERYKVDKDELHYWIRGNHLNLKQTGKFSNHRKYESVQQIVPAFEKYEAWVGDQLSHVIKFDSILAGSNNRQDGFLHLYNSAMNIHRFGRMGAFDYTTMIGKLKILDIEPGSPFFKGATGPVPGARLLFEGPEDHFSVNELEELVIELGNYLNVYYSMQILEDALCNWQKSSRRYKYFKG